MLTAYRWDDDVVFKNQARGTEDKKQKEFVNDLLRSDFHKRFMVGPDQFATSSCDANAHHRADTCAELHSSSP